VKKILMLAMVLGLLVSGCGDIAAKKDKFQLIASSDGKIYRIDKENGKVSVIENGELKEIKEGRQTLKVGEFYTTEDGKVVKYIGSTSQKVWKRKSDGTWAQDGEQKYILEEAKTWEQLMKEKGWEVPKRLPGETIPEYDERMRKLQDKPLPTF